MSDQGQKQTKPEKKHLMLTPVWIIGWLITSGLFIPVEIEIFKAEGMNSINIAINFLVITGILFPIWPLALGMLIAIALGLG